MKNAYVVIKSNNEVWEEDFSSLNFFVNGGYAFDEFRVFSFNESRCKTAFIDLKNTYDNLVVVVENAYLPAVKAVLDGVYSKESFQNGTFAMGTYSLAEKSCFLLSLYGVESVSQIEQVCLPFLQRKYSARMDKSVIRCVGANKERVLSLLARAKDLSQNKIAFYHTRKYGEDRIESVYGENVSKILADDVLRLFADGLNDSVYALENVSLEEQLVKLLKLRGKKLSVAESFTGGGIAKRITSVSGASEVFFEGLNTYNELSKIKRLGVSNYTLNTVGAVSDQTAYEMAMGLLSTGDCDISIATTGLAGPNSDKSRLPVGTCYIAVGTTEKVFVYRYKFDGTRREITETAINYALFLAYNQLKKM